MERLKPLADVVADWNFQFQQQDEIEDQETLDVLMDMILFRISVECGLDSPNIRMINSKGQVEIVSLSEEIVNDEKKASQKA